MSGAGARLAHLLAVLLAVSAVNFFLVDALPGDAALAALGETATEDDLAALRGELGLDRPMHERYLGWIGAALRGDLGRSLHTGEPVAALIGARLGTSLTVVTMALAMAMPLAVLMAVSSATAPGSLRDRALSSISFAVVSTPTFVIGLLLMLVFSVQLKWLPAAGFSPLSEGLPAHLRSLALPALALALAEVPVLSRVLRGDLITVLAAAYVRAAYGRGLPLRRVLAIHVLPPASLTLITVIALNAGNLIGGAVIVETLFAIPGIGRLLVDAVNTRDLTLIQGIVLVLAVAYVLFNALADVAVARLDPRARKP